MYQLTGRNLTYSFSKILFALSVFLLLLDTVSGETYSSQRPLKSAELQTGYDDKARQREIALLKKVKSIQDLEINKQVMIRNFFILVCALIVVIVVILFNRNKIKTKAKERLLLADNEKRIQQEFARKLIESQESERKRIAAELHDDLGQNLLVIKNRAFMGMQFKDSENKLIEQLEEISTAASDALKDVRQIAYNLHPYQLDKLGISETIKALIEKINSSFSAVRVLYEIDNIDNMIRRDLEINIYRIIQESLNNIIKHSDATEAYIKISEEDEHIQLLIEDNGKGFDAAGLSGKKGKISTGLGLISLQERTGILDGELQIMSVNGRGTKLFVTIPKCFVLTGNNDNN